MELIIYLNGKRATKEELAQHEIKNERIKQIFLRELKRRKGKGRQD